jgi:hypothetical protein
MPGVVRHLPQSGCPPTFDPPHDMLRQSDFVHGAAPC